MLQERYFGSVKIQSVDLEQLKGALKKAAMQIKEQKPGVVGVYLFGSFARGDFTPLSDIDILILVTQSDRPFLERKEQYIDYFKVPFDVNTVVYTLDEEKALREEDNLFLRRIMNEVEELV